MQENLKDWYLISRNALDSLEFVNDHLSEGFVFHLCFKELLNCNLIKKLNIFSKDTFIIIFRMIVDHIFMGLFDIFGNVFYFSN